MPRATSFFSLLIRSFLISSRREAIYVQCSQITNMQMYTNCTGNLVNFFNFVDDFAGRSLKLDRFTLFLAEER